MRIECEESAMLDINRDINSLSNFKRHTPEFIRQLKETGEPVVLTVNGKAEIVVQDSASYQRLLERAERAERMDSLKKSVQEMKDGLSIPAEDVLAAMRQVLDSKKAE
jgi:prevent-host-death family protein